MFKTHLIRSIPTYLSAASCPAIPIFSFSLNVTENVMKELGYLSNFNSIEFFLEKQFTKPLVMYSNDTYQFDDYSKYKIECFSEEEKAKTREIQFPLDCQRAFEIGINLIK